MTHVFLFVILTNFLFLLLTLGTVGIKLKNPKIQKKVAGALEGAKGLKELMGVVGKNGEKKDPVVAAEGGGGEEVEGGGGESKGEEQEELLVAKKKKKKKKKKR